MIAAIEASPNLNPDIAGYDNLGAYGQWQDVAGYGQSWVPNQQQGWSPYGNGNWSWEDGYGWTWVGAEPWGWAPYHYGNWYYANGYGWAWQPPAYSASPAWSPALVGFFGFGATFGGPGFGVSVGFGYPNIGWYPLAPYWPYSPWYPGWAWTGFGWGWGGFGCCGGFGGTRVVNVTNITNIYRRFPHRRRPRHDGRELPARSSLRPYVLGRSASDQRPGRNDSRTGGGDAEPRQSWLRRPRGQRAGNALEEFRLAAIRFGKPRARNAKLLRRTATLGLTRDRK